MPRGSSRVRRDGEAMPSPPQQRPLLDARAGGGTDETVDGDDRRRRREQQRRAAVPEDALVRRDVRGTSGDDLPDGSVPADLRGRSEQRRRQRLGDDPAGSDARTAQRRPEALEVRGVGRVEGREGPHRREALLPGGRRRALRRRSRQLPDRSVASAGHPSASPGGSGLRRRPPRVQDARPLHGLRRDLSQPDHRRRHRLAGRRPRRVERRRRRLVRSGIHQEEGIPQHGRHGHRRRRLREGDPEPDR
mmetsp:Transcript_25446/g.59590  ORF Transcript_25446/g.59590 Transcript_25446/m.59590 type:complete len:248 (-) Transcript_25446:97-840(-)